MTIWTDYQDDISDAISESMDADWSASVGARAVVAWLNEHKLLSAAPAPEGGAVWFGVTGAADETEALAVALFDARCPGIRMTDEDPHYYRAAAQRAMQAVTDELDTPALATREEAPAPTCQRCGGEIAGWCCQNCPAEFRENDDGAIVFDEEEVPAETPREKALEDALSELVAMVRGECPSLLNEDSGGNSKLDEQIDAALRLETPSPVGNLIERFAVPMREKVIAAIRTCAEANEIGDGACHLLRKLIERGDSVGRLADAILTALASGSGDHAELVERLTAYDHCSMYDGSDWEDVAREAAVCLEALLAENAALRGILDERDLEVAEDEALIRNLEAQNEDAETRAIEAERKLAEAVGLLRDCLPWVRKITDLYGHVSAWLSKEVERG